MVDDTVAVFFRNSVLQRFNFRIVKFVHTAAFDADDMIMMVALVQFVHGLARFEMMPLQNTRLFKLGQHTLNRGDADFDALFEQDAVNIFRAQMLFGMGLEQIQNLQARAGNFQSAVLQLRNIAEIIFHSIQYPCDVITVIIRTFSRLAHYGTIKVFNKLSASIRDNHIKSLPQR